MSDKNTAQLLTEIEDYKKLVSRLNGTIKSYEKQIELSKELFNSLSDNIPVMIWKTDSNQLCDYVNKVWLEFTGRTFDEETGNGLLDSIHPEDFENSVKIYNSAFEKKEKFQIQYRHKRYDGQYRILFVRGVPRYGLDGSFLGYLGSCLDITDLKSAEEVAQRNYNSQKVINSILNLSMENITFDEMLQSALQNILSIPWLKKKESGCIFLYDRRSQNLRLKAHHNIGQQLKLECTLAPMGNCLCSQAVKLGETQFADNIDNCHAIKFDNKSPYGHYCIPISTTDQVLGVLNVYLEENHKKNDFEIEFLNSVSRYLAQIILNKSAEENLKKLSSAVEQTADHIIITDSEGIIEYTNKAFEDLTGYSRSDWVGKTPRILKSGVHEKSVYDHVWGTILSGCIHRGITINKKKNGEFYHEEKTITPLIDANGTITHFVSTGRDITERIRAEAELLEAKEMAEKSERLKSDFLAQMSHEIRTPVNSILNFTSLLKYELQDGLPEELRSMFTYIDSGGRRLIRTIDLILNMSQIQTESLRIDKIKIDLGRDVLGDVFMELLPSANEKKVKLTYETTLKFSPIFGDLYTTGQIFTNIIDNAIKFTDHGEVKVILYENNDSIVVDVIDTGVGISEEFMLTLFQPFSQEETGYTRRFEGNGLGLALVKKYVEANDASISVESKKGVGTKFTVSFKRHQQ